MATPKSFTCCYICEVEFEPAWTDEEAIAEKNALFGDVPMEDCEVVCDPCWRMVMGLPPATAAVQA
jgi:hypothetical protein